VEKPNPTMAQHVAEAASAFEQMRTGHEHKSVSVVLSEDTQHRLLALLLDSQPNVAALIGVLGGIGEQVHHHLLQPGRVGVQPDRFRRQRHREFMLALVNQRVDRRHRIFHDNAHGDPVLVKLNPIRGNARDFEQFVNDPFQLSHLTLDDAGGKRDQRPAVRDPNSHVPADDLRRKRRHLVCVGPGDAAEG
jgi:hypothetical protein